MIATATVPQTTIISLEGHIDAASATDLKNQLAKTVASDTHPAILVDMERVEFLDSAGLMVLVSTLSLAQRLGRKFGLCAVSPAIRMIFELTQLDRVFEIFDNRYAFETALAVA